MKYWCCAPEVRSSGGNRGRLPRREGKTELVHELRQEFLGRAKVGRGFPSVTDGHVEAEATCADWGQSGSVLMVGGFSGVDDHVLAVDPNAKMREASVVEHSPCCIGGRYEPEVCHGHAALLWRG